MKKLLTASVLALGFWAGAAQAVTTVTYDAGVGTLPANVGVYQNFDAFAAGAALPGTNAFAYSMNSTNGARPAFGSTGNYASVLNGGTYTTSFAPSSVFSFVIGSLDTFNTLTLRYADGSSQIYSGGQIINDLTFPSGNQISGETNGVVTYRVTSGALLTGATFASTGNSFEFDNLATAVPEPAAWSMMILGVGLVGGAMRRRTTAKVKFA